MTVVTADAMAAGSAGASSYIDRADQPTLRGNRSSGHRCLHRSGFPCGSQGGAHSGDHSRGTAAWTAGQGTCGHGRFRVRQFLRGGGRQGNGGLRCSQCSARCARGAHQLFNLPHGRDCCAGVHQRASSPLSEMRADGERFATDAMADDVAVAWRARW